MKYIVYLTVCNNENENVNGINRIFVGVHATEDPSIFDGYLGDGVKVNQASSFKYPKTLFQLAVKKYGVTSFSRYVLYVCNTPEEAYKLEGNIVNKQFVSSPFTYNSELGGVAKLTPINQFSFDGTLIRRWKSLEEVHDFYCYTITKFMKACNEKRVFLGSLWSYQDSINPKEFNLKPISHYIYLYTNQGKLIKEYTSIDNCCKDINVDGKVIAEAIKSMDLICDGKYYVSNKMSSIFSPHPRRQYLHKTFYVYKEGELIGSFEGKEVMNVIGLHSWAKIAKIFSTNHNWYRDFYITLQPIENAPKEQIKKAATLLIYTKYGKFIEELPINDTMVKYKVPKYMIKRFRLGDKYFGDYIFKYNK
jgi:hypothetical protein